MGSGSVRDGSKDIMINAAERIISKRGELGAFVVTGSDKVHSGFGNGDCVLINLRHAFFALSDSAERYPRASREILERLNAEVDLNGLPSSADEWLSCVNTVYAGQRFQHKATFSCIAFKKGTSGIRAFIISGGDSMVYVYNRSEDAVEYRSEPDMYFAGRSKHISKSVEIVLTGDDYRVVLCSDGLADLARVAGMEFNELMRDVAMNRHVHEVPSRLRGMLASGIKHCRRAYDDIGVIVIDPVRILGAAGLEILMGGTSPHEEGMYQNQYINSDAHDIWIKTDELHKMTGIINACGIRVL